MKPIGERPTTIEPGSFEPERHFYPRVLNAQIHPLVRYFMDLGNARIAARYCHVHPEAERSAVGEALRMHTRHFRWGGCDLLNTTTEDGLRRIVVIETNSCPSGQKSMPLMHEREEQAGYRVLLERSFLPALAARTVPQTGDLAVLHDKNKMETTGYAAVLADLTGLPVHWVPCYADAANPTVRTADHGLLEVRTESGEWRPIRACLRYVTQRPWARIPPVTRTLVYNPVVVCLAGGRNKMIAAKAYDFYNAELRDRGLHIRVPETCWDVAHDEVPLWVQRMGALAVVKVPYSNAGQGVYTITSPHELEAFMDVEQRYDRFIVQALVGNVGWSSRSASGRLYHVGLVPTKSAQIHVADLRFMIGNGPDGFFPVAVYARRAREPLAEELGPDCTDSWSMLGTNLSFKLPDGSWGTDTDRLLLMDSRDFNRLGIGIDDLIEAYLQTVLAVTAIDRMAQQLVTQKGRFRKRLFESLNPDPALIAEISGI
ncbi:MAG: hypothetical protein HY908_21795 [Myxococcales bacterium]|nr:hypothetical protein [Myxococcales bacterium]